MDTHTLDYPDGYQLAILQLIQESQRYIRIYSETLEAAVYDSNDIKSAMLGMVRKHRNAEIRILINEARELSKHGHALLTLARQLPSSVKIKIQPWTPDRYQQDFMVSDSNAVARRAEGEDKIALLQRDARPLALDMSQHFDYLWDRGKEDPELRSFTL